LFQPAQALLEEALAPLADHFPAGVQPGRDEVIGQVFGGQEDHFGAEDLKVWQRILGGSAAQLLLLAGGQNYGEWAYSRHSIARPSAMPIYHN
jgi:hypothetical protein